MKDKLESLACRQLGAVIGSYTFSEMQNKGEIAAIFWAVFGRLGQTGVARKGARGSSHHPPKWIIWIWTTLVKVRREPQP